MAFTQASSPKAAAICVESWMSVKISVTVPSRTDSPWAVSGAAASSSRTPLSSTPTHSTLGTPRDRCHCTTRQMPPSSTKTNVIRTMPSFASPNLVLTRSAAQPTFPDAYVSMSIRSCWIGGQLSTWRGYVSATPGPLHHSVASVPT